MRNNFFLLCVVLLMEGVSGDVAVQVLTGDSVTLKPVNVTLKKNDLILWKRNGTLISTMKKAEDSISITFPDKKFSGRLKPDNKTGSLIITNITTDLAGLYQVVMKTTTETSESYSVTVNGNVESVSMLEGDSVTLHTGVTKKQGDQILWKFGDKNLTGDVDYTITNICKTGHYEVEIQTSSIILHRKFSITCSGGERTMSKMEGKPITLDTSHIKIQGYDQILWEFEGQIIAEIDQGKNLFLHHDSRVERLKSRLQLDKNSGSLTINFSRKTDSGVYHLQMNSRSYTLQRNISVTVSVSSGAVSRIYSASFGLVVWAVTLSLLQV